LPSCYTKYTVYIDLKKENIKIMQTPTKRSYKKRKTDEKVALDVALPQAQPRVKSNGHVSGSPKKVLNPAAVEAAARALVPNIDAKTELEGIRQKVFLDRYSLKDLEGKPVETTVEQMWQRVAGGIALEEKTPALQKEWAQKFYQAMTDFKFVPAGRILSGAGTGYEVTFFNCYVIPSPKDSRGGIMENITHTVEIQARGGGVGINLASLRPSGARVKKVNGTSSGPVSWAKLYSAANHDVIQQGGCFAADSLIMTHLGLTPIREIIDQKRDYYVSTHKGYKKVTAKFDNGVKDLFEVKTAAGYSVKVTSEHKLLTVDQNGSFYLKPLGDFKVGESTALLLGDWRKDIPYTPLNTVIANPSKFSYGRVNIDLPKTLDEKLAFFMGAYDSDGSRIKDEFSPNGKGIRIAVAQNRPKDLELLVQVIRDLFGVEPKLHQGDGAVINVQVYSRQLNEFLHLNGLLKKSSVSVEVPQLIFNSPRSVVEAYIAGVFFGDGTNRGGKGGFRISTVSEKFAKQLQLLLINLGIPAKIQTQLRVEENWLTLYNVTINGNQFMQKFYKIIKPFNEKAEDNPISVRDGSFNWPFNLTERFAYLANFQRTIARTNPTTSFKSVAFLENNLPLMINPQDKDDVQILTSTVSDKIVSIEYLGKENVYDLEVEEVHLLSGNGFYTSNSRRGALMLMLHDWHPDIIHFIHAKEDGKSIPGANLSVCISDGFMAAVEADGDWTTRFPDTSDPEYDALWDGDIEKWEALGKPVKVYETYKARDIWDQICTSAWASAEPGLHFLERSNKLGNTWYFEKLLSTNPCGEQPLGEWAVCNLGAMNLSAFVKDDGSFDYTLLDETVRTAMRFMDNVVDANYYFFEENETKAKEIRRTGIGTMGLGDTLIKLKLRYGSEEAMPVVEKIYKTIRDASYETSAELAKEKGSFPKFDKEKYLQGHFIQQLTDDVQKKIAKYGIRNAVILTQAPTGTTSLLAGASSGIEPVFDFKFIRRDRIGEHVIYHPLFQKWQEENPGVEYENRPSYFVGANDMSPLDHVRVQALVQKYTDSSISKTANAPHEFTVDQVKELYMEAYKLGCKGVTFFRDGSREGVLYHDDKKEEKKEEAVEAAAEEEPREGRPMILRGRTYEVVTPVGKAFVTVNRDEKEQPFEVFITVGKGGMHTQADAEAIGRLTSISLRIARGNRREIAQKIVSQLSGIGGSSHVGFGKNRVMSLADAVSKVLAEDLALSETIEPKEAEQVPLNMPPVAALAEVTKSDDVVPVGQMNLAINKQADLCPECGEATFVREDGCQKCYSCGYSKC
jgi:adenosylcobalamin-dependent ribonucleoside-diphosphate reductase